MRFLLCDNNPKYDSCIWSRMTNFSKNNIETDNFDQNSGYFDRLNRIIDPSFSEIDRILFRYIAFNAFFIGLCILETTLLILFFTMLSQSLVLALGLAIVFFTFFTYFTLRIYFHTKKPEQLKIVKDNFLCECKALIHDQDESSQHISLANACHKFANRLHAREYSYYKLPSWFSFLNPWMEYFSCRWHWRDLYTMKELLLQEAVNEHLHLVKKQPTSLEAHATLANAYVMLSGLYIDPRRMDGYDDDRWIPEDKYNDDLNRKFRNIAERAIEEFKIIGEYAPDDPWVHSQLAYSYHDMQMPLEEIHEYETIQKLLPADKDNLYKLGMLYFQQGMNAKGLRIYEELKTGQYGKAENLIKHYGSYTGSTSR